MRRLPYCAAMGYTYMIEFKSVKEYLNNCRSVPIGTTFADNDNVRYKLIYMSGRYYILNEMTCKAFDHSYGYMPTYKEVYDRFGLTSDEMGEEVHLSLPDGAIIHNPMTYSFMQVIRKNNGYTFYNLRTHEYVPNFSPCELMTEEELKSFYGPNYNQITFIKVTL